MVLSADEVVRFLEAVPSLKTRAALTTAYAAGRRASEAVGLRLSDIDSGRMVIRVEHGKGGKDRYVMLSAQLLGILRTYWLLEIVESGPIPAVHGVVRWRLIDLAQWVFEEFRISISKQTLSRLAPLGQARNPRQHHPDAAAAQIAGTQSGRKHLAVHARQLALQSGLPLLR